MNKRDRFYFWYFIVHIPVTVLVDSSLVIPSQHRSWIQELLVRKHIEWNHDFLLQNPPLWLVYFGVFELLFQLPLFVLGAYRLYCGCRKIYVLLALYGFNAFFTTGVCLTYVCARGPEHGLSGSEVSNLLALYVPYLLIPGFMMCDCVGRSMTLIGEGGARAKLD